jgi:hypothetical protein
MHRKKGALGRLLAEVRRGAIPRGRWLLIENIDRLSREPVLDALDVFRDVLRSGITIATLDMKWILTEARLNDPAQTWMLNAIVSMMGRAHEESFQKSRRLKETKREKRKRIVEGGAVESHACAAWLSFDKGGGRYMLNQHAPAIARLFELAAQHVSQYRIALQLLREGYMPPKGGDQWQTSYISKVLRNDAALGTYRPSIMVDGIERKTGDVVLDYYPAVTTAEIFKRAKDAKRTKHASTGAKGKTFANLFSRICVCGECGSPMVINSVNKRERRSKIAYLMCTKKRSQRGCTAKRNLRYDILQSTVLRNVREIDVAKLVRDDVADARITGLDAEIAQAERRVADLSDVIENLLDKIERVKGDAWELQARIEKRTAERAQARGDTARIRAERDKLERERQSRINGPELVERYVAELDGTDAADRYIKRANLAGVLRTFIDAVTFHPATNEVHVKLWGGRKVYGFRADTPDAVWSEIKLSLPGVSRSEAESYIGELASVGGWSEPKAIRYGRRDEAGALAADAWKDRIEPNVIAKPTTLRVRARRSSF